MAKWREGVKFGKKHFSPRAPKGSFLRGGGARGLRVRLGPLDPRVCSWGPPHEADTLPGQSRPVVPAGTPPGRAVGSGRGGAVA